MCSPSWKPSAAGISFSSRASKTEGTLDELRSRYIRSLRVELRADGWEGRSGRFVVEAPSYGELPALIARAAAESRLYEARILNDDLESVYFQIRKEES